MDFIPSVWIWDLLMVLETYRYFGPQLLQRSELDKLGDIGEGCAVLTGIGEERMPDLRNRFEPRMNLGSICKNNKLSSIVS